VTNIKLAKDYLKARWNEQVEHFPLMRQEIPLAKYTSVNLPYVLRNEPRMVALRDGKPFNQSIWL